MLAVCESLWSSFRFLEILAESHRLSEIAELVNWAGYQLQVQHTTVHGSFILVRNSQTTELVCARKSSVQNYCYILMLSKYKTRYHNLIAQLLIFPKHQDRELRNR